MKKKLPYLPPEIQKKIFKMKIAQEAKFERSLKSIISRHIHVARLRKMAPARIFERPGSHYYDPTHVGIRM